MRADPLGGGRWAVMRLANEDTIHEVLAHAQRALPLEAIATGPAQRLGMGREFRAISSWTSSSRTSTGSPRPTRAGQLGPGALAAEAPAALEQAAAAEPDGEVRAASGGCCAASRPTPDQQPPS